MMRATGPDVELLLAHTEGRAPSTPDVLGGSAQAREGAGLAVADPS
jgi:hypothetical protein